MVTRLDGEAAGERVGAVLIALLALCAFFTLFIFRAADDNRLTSWQWVFDGADAARMGGILVAGLALAYPLSKVSLPRCHPAAVLFLASFAIGTIFWREPELIVDAARYFTQAKHLELYGIGSFLGGWGREVAAWTDLPLVPFLYGVTFAVWGESRLPIQVLTTLLFSGTVVLTYWLGTELWDERIGAGAGALLLGMPYLLTQVPLMLVDVPTMFFLTLAVLAAVKAVRRGGPGWMALASGAVACAVLSKFSTWPLLSVLGVIVLVHAGKEPGAILRRAGAILLAPAVLAGAVVLWKHDVIREQLRLLWGYQVPGLSRWRESFASTFLFQIHPFITAAAAYSVVAAFRKRDSRYAIVAWALLLIVLFRIERIRYLLPTLPMLALMASYGLGEIKSREIRRFTVACAVTASLVVAVFGYLPHAMSLSAVNLKDAGAYLDSIGGGPVEVVTLPQAWSGINPAVSVPLLDLFTTRRLVYRPDAVAPPGEAGDRSPLRFTWDYRSPAYYSARPGAPDGAAALVLILGRSDQPLPEAIERRISGYRLARAFQRSDEWFQYRTLVRIYRAPEGMPPGGRS